MGERWSALAGLMLLIMVLAWSGCGSGSSTGAGSEETKGEKQVRYPRVKGPAREFLIPGGDNIVAFFGQEATPAERENASRVIHLWMHARVAQDWVGDCKYLSRAYSETLLEDGRNVSGGKTKNCPQALAFFGEQASGKLVNTLTGPIDSLRRRKTLKGGPPGSEEEAFALYHGRRGIDWVLPLTKEGGTWKVAAASPIERTK
ncbi:MAG TPA: hypothetical protein VFS64_06390 [Solirubrobacterales bacterium]|nr:hypothetical protein [Solirubrobacterales bacterium]